MQSQPLHTDSFLPSELTVSVLVNQMMLVKMLNDSSTTCSLHESVIARQEDVKQEVRRSVEMALTRLEEKKEEMLEMVTERETQLAALIEAALQEHEQRIKEELNATIQAAVSRKTFVAYAELVTRSAAMDACVRRGGRLAIPEGEEQHQQLLSAIRRQHTDHSGYGYWLAVDDQKEEGVWVNSHTGLPLSATNFADGEPDNYGTRDEDCVVLDSGNGRWYDV
nr:C-type lectin domain family 3 member B [Charybdis japonica]